MNSCPSQDTLRQLLASTLQDEVSRSVSEHLAQCQVCQQRADALTGDDQFDKLRGKNAPAIADPELLNLRERLYALAGESPQDSRLREGGAEEPPRVVGRYETRECLGYGGYGIVYRAEDTQLHREVALKLSRSGTLADPQSRLRFLNEARTVAGLSHPHIVALFDAGETDRICYLASAYIPGPTLSKWFAERRTPLAPDEAAQIVLALADAIQHAHETGVIHRDIKPQNILLDPTVHFHDLPFSPKLTDFGIAKLLDADPNTHATLTGQVLGTPRYMAPELASGTRGKLTAALDIYSLGVLFYELLTGRVPIEGDSHAETLRRLVTDEPVPPRRLRRDLPQDLEAVCLKCLEKDPQRRYTTAQQLADDLQRYLRREPTIARPIGSIERLARWTRRHPAVAGLLVVIITGVILSVAAMAIHNRQLDGINLVLEQSNRQLATALGEAKQAKAQAESSDNRTQQLLYIADMRLAGRAWREGDFRGLNELLARHIPKTPDDDFRGIEWKFLWNLGQVRSEPIDQIGSDIYFMSVSPDRTRLATCGKDATVRVYDLATKKLQQSIVTGQVEVNGVAFTPDGHRLASAGDNGSICVWNLHDGSKVLDIAAYPRQVFQVAFTPSGLELISSGNDPVVRVWDSVTGEPLGELTGKGSQEAIALSHDGKQLAVAEEFGSVRLWNLTERRQLHELRYQDSTRMFLSVAFSSDDQYVVAGGSNNSLLVWSTQTGKLHFQAPHLDPIHGVVVSPDGRRLASCDRTGIVGVWEAPEHSTGNDDPSSEPSVLRLLAQWQAHPRRINAVAFATNDQLITGTADGTVRAWPIPRTPIASSSHDALMHDPTFTHDNRLLALETDGTLVGWEFASDPQLTRVQRQSGIFANIATDREGKVLISCSTNGEMAAWDLTRPSAETPLTGTLVRSWPVGSPTVPMLLRLTPDAKSVVLLTGSPQKGLYRFDIQTGARISITLLPERSASQHFAISPDGSWLASKINNELLIWPMASIESGETSFDQLPGLVRVPNAHADFVSCTFAPHGGTLATCGSDRLVKLWNPQDGSLIATMSGHRGGIEDLLFSPDGSTLITGGSDGCIKFWSVTAREELFDLYREDGFSPLQFAYSPNRRRVACTCLERGSIWLFDLGESRVPGR